MKDVIIHLTKGILVFVLVILLTFWFIRCATEHWCVDKHHNTCVKMCKCKGAECM